MKKKIDSSLHDSNILKKSVDIFIYNKELVILICILVGGFFFRFYNIPFRYGFDYDAARDSLVSLEGASHLRIPLVGPPTSVGLFTFGPWYYYQLIITSLFSPKGYGPWISMGILSFLSIIVMYKIGKNIEDRLFGLILAALSAFSTSQIVLGTGLSNPNSVGFFSTVSFLFFVLYIKKDQTNIFLLLWGLAMGIGLLDHYQMIGIFALPIIAFLFKRKRLIIDGVSFSVGMLCAFIPIIIFDMGHKWHTISGIIYYVFHGTSSPLYVPNSWKLYITSFWPHFWADTLGVPLFVGVVVIAAFFLLISYSFYKRNVSTKMILILIAFIANFIYFRYYKGERVIYYLYFLQPFVFILTGYCIWTISRIGKYMIYGSVGLLLVIIMFAMSGNMRQLNSTQSHIIYGEYAKKILVYNDTKSLILFNCAKVRRERTYGITYLLSLENKISESGAKYGIYDQDCNNKFKAEINNSAHLNPITTISAEAEKISLINLSRYSTQELQLKGWLPVTSKRIYETMTVTLQNK